MDSQEPPQPNIITEMPKKSWLSSHKILGIIFLISVIAAVVSGIYYWQTVRQIPPTVALPVHVEKMDPYAGWKTYTNTQYGFEFKYPSDVFAFDIADHSNGQVPVVAGFGRSALNQYDAGNPPPADKAGVANIFVWPSVSQDLKTWVTSYESGIKDWTDTLISGTAALVNYRKVSSPDITPRTFKTYYVKVSNKIIGIYGSSETNQYSEAWIQQFDQIVATFKFMAPSSAVDTSTWKTYTNSQYKFTLKYPSDWKINDQSFTSQGHLSANLQISSPVVFDISGYEKIGAHYSIQFAFTDKPIVVYQEFDAEKQPGEQAVNKIALDQVFLTNRVEYKVAQEIIKSASILITK